MRIRKLLSFALAVILLLSAVWVIAQEGKQQMTPEQQKMMELMMKYGTPGEHHKLLEPFVGDWNVTARWWSSPDADPQVSQATSNVQWIMGGRYLQENTEGTMGGMPFAGMGIVGYDNYGQKFNSFWIDNMSTMFFTESGTANEDGSEFIMTGTYDDYMTGQKDKKTKTVIKVMDKDKHMSQMYDTTPDGKEYISLELTYTKKM